MDADKTAAFKYFKLSLLKAFGPSTPLLQPLAVSVWSADLFRLTLQVFQRVPVTFSEHHLISHLTYGERLNGSIL
jgi:hypothetical protein